MWLSFHYLQVAGNSLYTVTENIISMIDSEVKGGCWGFLFSVI